MLLERHKIKENWNPEFLSDCEAEEFNNFLAIILKDKEGFNKRKFLAFEKSWNILSNMNCPLFVTGGTLLGIIRDNKLIDWDDDIDMNMLSEDYSDWVNKIKKEFVSNDCVVRIKQDIEFPKLRIFCHGIKVSIDSLPLKGRNRVRPAYSYPDSFFQNPNIYQFHNLRLITPNPPKKYLEHVYGKSWIKPNKSNVDVEYMSSAVMNLNPLRFYVKKFIYLLKKLINLD